MRSRLLVLSVAVASLIAVDADSARAAAAQTQPRANRDNEAAYRLAVLLGWTIGPERTKYANDVLFPAWVAAVERHTPGEADDAAREISQWSGDDLDLLFKWILFELTGKSYGLSSDARHVLHSPGKVATLVRRGAMLHADIAFLVPSNPWAPGISLRTSGRTYYIGEHSDGRAEGGFESTVHFEVGRALLSLLAYARLDEGAYASLWYRATSAALVQSGQNGYAEPQIRVGIEALPNDARLLFFAGALHEAFAAPRTQRGLERIDLPPGYASVVGPARAELQRAEKLYVRALRADPADDEARLHYGRVLGQLGRHAEAAAELARVDGKLKDPELAYFAALFRGQEEAELGHRDVARDGFERAAVLYPSAQSPLIALSRLARTHGDRPLALVALRRLFALPTDEFERSDPWWRYELSHVRDAETLMKELYAQSMREGAR